MQAATTAIEQFERHVEAGIPSAVVIRPLAPVRFDDLPLGGKFLNDGAVWEKTDCDRGAPAGRPGPSYFIDPCTDVQPAAPAATHGYTYQDYMARLGAVLAAAAPGAVLVVGPELGAALLNGKPVWFDLADDIENAADFDRSAWDDAHGCWDGETHAKTWGALENPVFAQAPLPTMTEAEYLAIPADYRSVWTTERTDWKDWDKVRHLYMGKRTMLRDGGLAVEGISFRIVSA